MYNTMETSVFLSIHAKMGLRGRKEVQAIMKGNLCAGIIAEYNPFHCGHLYHLQETRRRTGAAVVVAAMSGNFTQRGQLAILDKWSRAEAAVAGGVDLVVEIPTARACNQAAVFAASGVEILEALGVDVISFGSESGDLQALTEVSDKLSASRTEIEAAAVQAAKQGISWPRARREAMAGILTAEQFALLDQPNDLLGLAYLATMKRAEPLVIQRQTANHHDVTVETDTEIASATALRRRLLAGEEIAPWIPASTAARIDHARKAGKIGDTERLFPLLAYRVATAATTTLDEAPAGEEGLGARTKALLGQSVGWEDLVGRVKTKRYTYTRISRFFAQNLLGITGREATFAGRYPNAIRVLALNAVGAAYLKQVKKAGLCPLPILTNMNKEAGRYPQLRESLRADILAADLFSLATGQALYPGSDYVRMPKKMES